MASPLDTIRQPAPNLRRGGGVQSTPSSQPQTQPPTLGQQVNVVFPQPPRPILEAALSQRIRNDRPVLGVTLPWPRAGPLGVRAINTHDSVLTIQLFPSNDLATQIVLNESIMEFEVGVDQQQVQAIPPEVGWAPFIFTRAVPRVVPTRGDIDVFLARLGDL